ncbi:MAG: presenilin family intramembrane aspartyl protease [Thermoplasmata archaeon]|nr:presenilin family intramembrane aspartyl protease [Thermoplasmata archaeon]
MQQSTKAVIMMAALFTVAQIGALVMVASVLGEEYQAFEDPNDPLIPVYYLIAILFFTLLVLYIIKKGKENIVRMIFLGAVAYTMFIVLWATTSSLGLGVASLLLSLLATAALTYMLVKKPEWHVIDVTGTIVAIGVIGILGISLQILPVLVLLVALAVYDAVSVYGTKHMVALADGVTQMKLPILLVVPKKLSYSYLDQKPLRKQIEEGGEREAMFMGLGDVIIPGVLISSAFYCLAQDEILGIGGNLLVSLGTLVGALVGFSILMTFVLKGNPQAGLPLLNGGAIAGYFISYLLVFGDLSMGIVAPW